MQPIERYGVVALVFLVATIVAVVAWDRDPAASLAAQRALSREAYTLEPARAAESPRAALSVDGIPALSGTWDAPSPTPIVGTLVVGGGVPLTTAALEARARAEGEAALPLVPSSEPAQEQPITPAAPVLREHRLAEGETLGEIAQELMGSARRWRELAEFNGIENPRRLRAGTMLRIPPEPVPAAPEAASLDAILAEASAPLPTASTPVTGEGIPYTVRDGDSLWIIARDQLGSGSRFLAIAALNPDINPDRLVVGDTLRMPEAEELPDPEQAVAQASPSRASAPSTSDSGKGVVR